MKVLVNLCRSAGSIFSSRSLAPAASAGCFNPNPASLPRMNTAFGRKDLCSSLTIDERSAAVCAGLAAGQTVGLRFSSVAEKCDLGIGEQLNLPHQPVSAAKLSCAARTVTIAIGAHAKRIGIFERFDRCVQRVSHMAVNSGDTVHSRPCPHAARGRLVVSEGFIRPGVN